MLAPRRDEHGKIQEGKKGWYSTKPIRDLALEKLREAVQGALVTVHTRDAINEFRSFIQPEGQDKPVAVSGMHDDWVIAWAGVCLLRRKAPLADYRITSARYKETIL
jgi:hypothetical protein